MLNCPICLSDNVQYLYSLGTFVQYKCLTCKTIFTNPMTADFDYSTEETHTRTEYSIVEEICEILNNFKHSSLSILEIGCGDLRNLVKLKDKFHDIECYGYDLSYKSEILNKAKEKDIKLLSSLYNSDSSYNVIFLLHVLEHIENPREFLFNIYKKLKDNGYLILSVPNPGRTSALFFQELWDYPPYHLTRFDKESLKKLGDMLGMRTINIINERLNRFNFYIYRIGVQTKITNFFALLRKQNISQLNKGKLEGNNQCNTNNTVVQLCYRTLMRGLIKFISYSIAEFIFISLNVISIFNKKIQGLSLTAIFQKRQQKNNDRRIVVFDFDGTIIARDSFVMLSNYFAKKAFKKLLLIRLLFLLYNYKIISNTILKKLVFKYIWGRIHVHEIEQALQNICRFLKEDGSINEIVLNKIKEHIMNNDDVIVVSASPDQIVRLFLNEILNVGIKILGTKLLVDEHGYLSGLQFNLYGKDKAYILKTLGIPVIDIFYTDSYEDSPLMRMSKQVNLVDGNLIKSL